MGTYGIRDLDPKGKVIGREKNGEVALHSRSGTMEALVRGGVGSGDLWEFVPFSTNATSAPSHWQIRHVDTNTCLVDRDGRAVLDNCMASADRRWTVGPATAGDSTVFTLKNQSSGKFLLRSPEGSLALGAAAGEPAIWDLEIPGADWAIHGGWSTGIPLYQEDLQPAPPPPPPPLPYERPGGDLNWDQAEEICRGQGATLCSWDDVCPGGLPGTEPRVGILAGDVWMPVGDRHNNWISVGDAYPERLCRPHGELGGLPAWGTTTGPQAVTGVPAAMACCRR